MPLAAEENQLFTTEKGGLGANWTDFLALADTRLINRSPA